MKMKLLFTIVMFCSTVLLSSCSTRSGAGSDYKVLVLGDLHFDGAAYHQKPQKYKHRVQQKERNLAMWREKSPALLRDAARHLGKDVPFVIQVGDIIQGDGDTLEVQEKMFRDAHALVKDFMHGYPYIAITGNHDVRMFDENSAKAAENAYYPLIAKDAGLPNLKDGNFSLMQGPDLFIFLAIDVERTTNNGRDTALKGTLASFVKKELEAHPRTRYVFLVTHLPLFPASAKTPDWLTTDHAAIRDLLMSRNAIVLAGHTHVFSHIVYKDKENRRLPQLITDSTGDHWKPEQDFKEKLSGYAQFRKMTEKQKRATLFPKDFPADSLPVFTLFTAFSGHTVLEINDKGVTARIYTGKPQESLVIPLLTK